MVKTGSPLVLERGTGSALFAFESPRNGSCLESAILRARTATVDPSPIAAWVSVETEVAQLPDGASLGGAVVAPGSPTVNATFVDGVATWDVTALVAWAAANQPDAESLVVAVKPVFGFIPVVELGSSESGDPATLTVMGEDFC